MKAKRKVTIKELHKLHELYMCGMSLAKLAENYGNGLTRQSVHQYFKRAGLPTRKKNLKPYKIYKGEKYTMCKDSYYRKTTGNREHLHRKIWEDANGKIDEDMCVVFKSGSSLNFDDYKLENLKLENSLKFFKKQGRPFEKGKNYHGDSYNEHFKRGLK